MKQNMTLRSAFDFMTNPPSNFMHANEKKRLHGYLLITHAAFIDGHSLLKPSSCISIGQRRNPHCV
jgi:hypothetical protein